MARLGSRKRPAVVRVRAEDRASEILELCEDRGWHVIVGIEPEGPEDISDLERLLSPPQPAKQTTVGRNEPCPCGSGKKFKKCCLGRLPSSAH